MGDAFPQSGHLALKRGDLGAAHESRSARLTRGSAVGDAVASEKLPSAGGKAEARVRFLETEGGLEIGYDRHSLEESAEQSMGGSRRADDIGGPADRAFGKHGCLLGRNRKQVAGQDRGAALGGLAQCLEGLLGHAGIGEDDRAAGGTESRLNGGDLGLRDLDQRGECPEDSGLVELGPVESAQDGLGSLAEPFSLALELEQDLKAVLALGELLHGRGPFGLRGLAGDLRLVVGLLRGDELLLGGIERGTCGGLRGRRLLGAGGCGRDRQAGHGDLFLELEGAGALGVAACSGGGEFASDVGEAVLQFMQAAGQRLVRLLGGDALALRLGNARGGGCEGFLLGAEHLEKRGELGVRLLDLALLFADAEMGGVDVGARAEDHLAELPGSLGIGLDAVLAGEDAVAQGLQVVAGPLGLGVECGKLLAGAGDLDLLLGDLALVEGAGVGALVDLGGHLGDGAVQVEVGAVGEMGVEDAEILHEGLVAAGLACLSLERSDLALDLLDDVGDPEEVRLGVLELAESLFLLGLVLGYAGGLLEDGAAVFRAAVEQEGGLPLLHDGVGAPADAGVHEEIVDVLEAAGGPVDQVLGLAVAEDAPGDPDLVPLHAELLLALGKGHRDLGHVVGLAGVGAAEDDIRHFTAAQGLCRLFAKHPADGVQDVRLAAAVGADDGGHSTVEAQGGLRGEGFESDQFEGLKKHGKGGEMRRDLSVGWRKRLAQPKRVKNYYLLGCYKITPQDIVVLISSARISLV